jgi:hypothetical protein
MPNAIISLSRIFLSLSLGFARMQEWRTWAKVGPPDLPPLPKHTTWDFNPLIQTPCRWSSNLYTPRVHHSSSQGGKSPSHLRRVTLTLLTQLIVDWIWDFSHNDNSPFWEGYTNKAFTTISLSLELLYELNLNGSNELEYMKRKNALSSKLVCFSLDW